MIHFGGSKTHECSNCGSRLIENEQCLTCDSTDLAPIKMKWYYMNIKWLDDEMEDAIMGANESDALESAYKNWPDAIDIVPVEGKTQDTTEKELNRYIPKLIKLHQLEE